jgi:hypothetical protein
MKTTFSKKDLVKFGKHLLSKKRNEKIIGDKDEVHDADLENFIYSLKKIAIPAFEKEKVELEVGKWYKCIEKEFESLIFITDIEESKAYGFSDYGSKNIWKREGDCSGWTFKRSPENWVLAATEEVAEALTKEAVKMGIKNGIWIKDCNNIDMRVNGRFVYLNGVLYFGGAAVFKDGYWLQKIKTKTKEEAEKELNCKII